MQAIYGSHGDAPRVVLAPRNVEDCFYIAVEAVRGSPSEYSAARSSSSQTMVHQPAASKPSDEPNLAKIMDEAEPDVSDQTAPT